MRAADINDDVRVRRAGLRLRGWCLPGWCLSACLVSVAWGSGAAAQTAASAPAVQPDDLLGLASVSGVQVAAGGRAIVARIGTPDREHDRRRSELRLITRASNGTLQSQVIAGASSPRWSRDGRRLFYVAGEGAGTRLRVRDVAGDGSERDLLALPAGVIDWSMDRDERQVAVLVATPLPPPAWSVLPALPPASQLPVVVDHVPYRREDGSFLTPERLQLQVGALDDGNHDGNHGLRVLALPDDADLVATETGGASAPTWSADGRSIVVSVARGIDTRFRLWNRNRDLLRLDVDGTGTQWIAEDARVEVEPRYSPDGRYLAYLRQRGDADSTVYQHELIVQDLRDGRVSSPLQSLDADIAAFAWQPEGRGLVVQYLQRARDTLARVDLTDTLHAKLHTLPVSAGAGFDLSSDGHLGFVPSAHDAPPEAASLPLTTASASSAARVQRWTTVNQALSARRLSTLREIDYPSAHVDGRRIHALVAIPAGQHDLRRLPVVVDLHGGPYSASRRSFDPTRELFAGLGYIVVQPNYRGSLGYGDAFSRLSDRRHYPGWHDQPEAAHEMGMDVVGVLAALRAQGLGDPRRVFLRGVSAGALLTTWTLGRTDGFRAAVAQSWYPGEWGAPDYGYFQLRRYFTRMPWEDGGLDAIWRRDPIRLADRVNTPLLLIQGERDWITPLTEVERYYYALRTRANVSLVVYPDEIHGLRRHPASLRNALLHEDAWFRQHGPETP